MPFLEKKLGFSISRHSDLFELEEVLLILSSLKEDDENDMSEALQNRTRFT